jgi:hypothetical protein
VPKQFAGREPAATSTRRARSERVTVSQFSGSHVDRLFAESDALHALCGVRHLGQDQMLAVYFVGRRSGSWHRIRCSI